MSELLDRVRNLGYPTFHELFNSGKAVMDELEKYVEIWEQGLLHGPATLQDALGFDAKSYADWRHPASRVIKEYQHKLDFLAGKTKWSPFADQIPTEVLVLVKHKGWVAPQVMRRQANQPTVLYRVGHDGKNLAGFYSVSAVYQWAPFPE